MNKIKHLIKKYFESFAYFYKHLKSKIFIIFGLSLIIGILDGLGLTMFLPLLQMVQESSQIDPESLGKLAFILDFFSFLGLEITLLTVLAIMVFFFLLKGLIYYFAGIYRVLVQQDFVTKLRLKNIKALNNLSYKYFVTSDVGRIQNTLTGEVDRVARSFTFYFRAFQNGIMILIYMLFAFGIDPQFAVLVTLGGGIANFFYKRLYKFTKSSSKTLTADANVFQSLVIQNVANYKYLKATGAIKRYEEKLRTFVKKIEKSNKHIGNLDALLLAGREPILIVIVVSIIFLQTQVLGSELGPILISLIFFYRALNYLMQMQMDWNRFLAVSGSVENMTSFENELKKNQEVKGVIEFGAQLETIEVINVYFSYSQDKILSDIKLDIKKNETIAFVGESGSGKTTLVNLIAGLLPPDSGQILVNGYDLNLIQSSDYQEKIGYITQDSVIFNDSLFNNVTLWSQPTNENIKKFWKVIEESALTEFVHSFSQQENLILGNNGVNLSGGQKQRISIARELFKEVQILILDEATSALDSKTEKAIQQSIDELKGKYTILAVAHRISTIKNADRIVVMKNGRIENVNSFNNLLNESLDFKRFVELQEI